MNTQNNEELIIKLENRLEELLNDLKNSAMDLDQLDAAMAEYEKDILKTEYLEELYAKEFSLAIDNSSIYEKIEQTINKLLSLDSSNFKARRLEKEADKYLRVALVDV